MMNLQHRVQINIADRSGQKKQVLGSKKVRLPQRLLNLIFGDFCEVLVLTPGTSVRNIEIHQLPAMLAAFCAGRIFEKTIKIRV